MTIHCHSAEEIWRKSRTLAEGTQLTRGIRRDLKLAVVHDGPLAAWSTGRNILATPMFDPSLDRNPADRHVKRCVPALQPGPHPLRYR